MASRFKLKAMDSGADEATAVATAEELQAAMDSAATHITITQHLDLSSLRTVEVQVEASGGGHGSSETPMSTALDAASGFKGTGGEHTLRLLLGNVQGPTLTIRGNCSEAPPREFLTAARTGSRAPLLPLAPLQCMLLADSSVLAVPEDTYVWLDGLYLRFLRTARSPRHPVLASIGSAQAFTEDKQRSGTLFMTAMAFQGDQVYGNAAAGETSVAGISHVHPEMAGSAEACRILLDGSVFANLGGGMAAAVSLVNAQVSLVGCEFRDNVAEAPQATVVSAGGMAAVRLEGCLFHGNAGAGQLLLDWTSRPPSSMTGYFADAGMYDSLQVAPAGGGGGGPVCHCRAGAQPPMTLAEAPPVFLTPSDIWLDTMQDLLGAIPRTGAEPGVSASALEANMLGACDAGSPGARCRAELVAVTGAAAAAVPASGSSREPLGGGAIAGVAAAATLLLVAAAALFACLYRRRSSSGASAKTSSTGMSESQFTGELERRGSGPRRGALSDEIKAPGKGAPAHAAPLGIVPSQCKPRLTAAQTNSGADAINMLAFPALARSAIGSTSSVPLLTGSGPGLTMTVDATEGGAASQDSSTIARGPEAAASALLMRSRSIGSSFGHLTRIPTLTEEAVAAAAVAGPEAAPPMMRCASSPSGMGVLPAAAVQQHQRLFHPATNLGTLEQSNAFETVARSVGGVPAVDPGQKATSSERLNFIAAQLDTLGRRGVVLGKYELLGPDERRRGGQAVVQFVRAPQTNDVFAMKVFASRRVFADERRLYLESGLASFMPTVAEFVDNEDGAFVDGHGAAMPPALVMEKGETLTERIHRCKHNIFTTIQILGQVGQCLAELHARGWVHRDLKPGNIMFLPRRGTWTLIDFGLVARAGDAASVGFTLLYAAPEVIVAHAAAAPSVVVDPAVDAWALGVMAFELLTGRPAFNMFFLDAEEVQRQLRGEAELPWEGDRLAPDLRRRLGTLKVPVLGMLHRDPAQRWTCEQFWRALHAVFSGQTTSDAAP